MYLRHRDLSKLMTLARESVVKVLEPGQFLKIGFDEKDGKRSYWLFVPDFLGD